MRIANRIIVTDFQSPAPESAAGKALQANMMLLHERGCAQAWPTQQVSCFDLPASDPVKVYIAGSPAGHDATGARTSDGVRSNHAEFNQEAFYSMTWHTPPESIVAMTYSSSSCPKMEWWTEYTDVRILMIAKAYFNKYRPRLGLEDNLDALNHDPSKDTKVALFLPPTDVPRIVWTGDGRSIDVPKSIAAWTAPNGKVMTLGAFTAELEVDILNAMDNRSRHQTLMDISRS
jgi:hypothetical protein